MKTVVLSAGDELILGQTVDTNSAWLSAELILHGGLPLYHKTVGDSVSAIAEAIREAAGAADLVIVSGGLGPTADDVTRQALSMVLGRPLALDPESLMAIRRFFEVLGRTMPEPNRIQAMHPEGTRMLPNPWGTAPGIAAEVGDSRVYLLPGVPREMKGMFQCHVVPWLDGVSGRHIATESLTTFGAGESVVAQALGELMARDRNPMVGTTVSGGEVTVRIRSESADRETALRERDATVEEVRKRLAEWVVSSGGTGLVEVTIHLARKAGRQVVTAESCTGGWIAKMLTDVPGASDVYRGGWVVYANALKESLLGVPRAMNEHDGSVSEAVAAAMAAEALRRSGADYALAVTGIAGPGGGSDAKPMGTVWIAVAGMDGGTMRTTCRKWVFPGDREMVRLRAAKTAINMLRLALLGKGEACA